MRATKCPHCGKIGFEGYDHSCPCPYSDLACEDHKIWTCDRPPKGWKCSGALGHDGPCPTYPRWYNLRGRRWHRKNGMRRGR
jgi:hypothetical protein